MEKTCDTGRLMKHGTKVPEVVLDESYCVPSRIKSRHNLSWDLSDLVKFVETAILDVIDCYVRMRGIWIR
jgi:hypothetical protein